MKIKDFVRILDNCPLSRYMLIWLRFENGSIDSFSLSDYKTYELGEIYDERIILSFTTQKEKNMQIADYVLNIKGNK